MTDKELRKLARKRVRARMDFVTHAGISVGVGAGLVCVYFGATPGVYFWPVWPLLGLGAGVLAHAASLLPLYSGRRRIEKEYQRLKRPYGAEGGE